jgi:hypothetical protein
MDSENESENEEEIDLTDQLNALIAHCETLEESHMEEFIIEALLTSFSDLPYVLSGSFGAHPFRVRKEIANALSIKETYSLSEYNQLLTSYLLSKKCIDKQGLVTPTPFLCKLFQISKEPCTIVKFLGLATRILL